MQDKVINCQLTKAFLITTFFSQAFKNQILVLLIAYYHYYYHFDILVYNLHVPQVQKG